MKIKILNSANQDLVDGYWFYEKQVGGLSASSSDGFRRRPGEVIQWI